MGGRLHQPRSESENLSLFGMECSCGILIVGGRYWVRDGSAYKIKTQIEKQANVNIIYLATFPTCLLTKCLPGTG